MDFNDESITPLSRRQHTLGSHSAPEPVSKHSTPVEQHACASRNRWRWQGCCARWETSQQWLKTKGRFPSREVTQSQKQKVFVVWKRYIWMLLTHLEQWDSNLREAFFLNQLHEGFLWLVILYAYQVYSSLMFYYNPLDNMMCLHQKHHRALPYRSMWHTTLAYNSK